MSSAPQALALYRQMLRSAGKFTQYNFREYALRRVKTGFRSNRDLDAAGAATAMEQARKDFEVLARQASVSQLFPGQTSVVPQYRP